MAGPYPRPAGSDQAGSAGDGSTSARFVMDALADGLEDIESVAVKGNGTLELVATSGTTATANRVGLFARKRANRVMPAFVGPAGIDTRIQPFLASNKIAYFAPLGNGTGTSNVGLNMTAAGTATGVNVATTNKHTMLRRLEYLVTSASSSAVAGWRGNGQQFCRGSVGPPVIGGFYFNTRWGPATGVSNTTMRAFVGLRASTAAPTDVEPSSLANILGFGWDAADTNMQFLYNDSSGTASKDDLGSNFVVPTSDRTAAYECEMFVAPGGSTVYYQVTDLADGDTQTGSVSTNIPAATTLLNPYGYCSVGGTSSVVGIALVSCYIETDD